MSEGLAEVMLLPLSTKEPGASSEPVLLLPVLIPLFHQGSSSAGSEPEPSFKPVLCLSTPKAPAPNQQKRFVSSTKTLLG